MDGSNGARSRTEPHALRAGGLVGVPRCTSGLGAGMLGTAALRRAGALCADLWPDTSLTSKQADLATLETFWRGHWTIENQSHYVRDVTCHEDAGQAWMEQAPQALCNGALALFRLAGWTIMAAAFRPVDACVSHAFILLDCAPPLPLRL